MCVNHVLDLLMNKQSKGPMTRGNSRPEGDILTHAMLITMFLSSFDVKVMGSLVISWVPKLGRTCNGFKSETFRFDLNTLSH